MYGPAPVRSLATVYIEFFRGIPVLLLLYFLYYGLPKLIGLKLDPLVAAILGLGLNYSAYEAEIYRAGISSIPQGNGMPPHRWECRRRWTFRRVIFPQAIRGILPPMTNDFVALFKDTSVVSIIAVVDEQAVSDSDEIGRRLFADRAGNRALVSRHVGPARASFTLSRTSLGDEVNGWTSRFRCRTSANGLGRALFSTAFR